ncbi:MAG: hypothetical protein VCD00_01920 [Candidatus Hydrogenedentota bacterium]
MPKMAMGLFDILVYKVKQNGCGDAQYIFDGLAGCFGEVGIGKGVQVRL